MYITVELIMYNEVMDVAVTELRAHLSDWLSRARQGEEVVVTDRGIPVARLLAVDAAPTLERLTNEGIVARPSRPRRPMATGQRRPTVKRPVAEIISDQRS
jgi:prevent-host-death family protein